MVIRMNQTSGIGKKRRLQLFQLLVQRNKSNKWSIVKNKQMEASGIHWHCKCIWISVPKSIFYIQTVHYWFEVFAFNSSSFLFYSFSSCAYSIGILQLSWFWPTFYSNLTLQFYCHWYGASSIVSLIHL